MEKMGLTTQEVKERTQKYGLNEITQIGQKSNFKILLEQFQDFLVLLLIAAAMVSIALKEVESAVVILIVITMNALLGMVQQVKAKASLEGLKKLTSPKVRVMRNGEITVIPGREIVPEDRILFEAGDALCADGILVEAEAVTINESALTGESTGVEKNIQKKEQSKIYSGCIVNTGRGIYQVTKIGMETEVGKIAGMVQNAQEKKTPLQLSLDEFGKRLSLAVLMVCAIIFFINVIRGETMADAFLFAVALAVAAIPEALSSIVTIVLALCTRTMAQENAIVRKLSSVESLGGVGVICTDKTGTLTQNKMTVTACNTFSKKEEPALVCASVLCNDAVIDGEKEIGDPTETALLNFAEKKEKGYVKQIQSTFQRKASIPFDSNRKCMSVCYKKEEEEKFFLITKGAVDVLLKQMTKKLEAGEIRKITKEDREKIKQLNEGFTEKGLRVLAFAGKRIEPLKETMQQEKIEQELCYLGLMAMSDPPRKESQESIKKCKEAGILTVMITGDHPKTAEAIAKEIGILSKDIGEELVLTGAELEEMSDEELRNKVLQTRVYARVSPKHKIRIVRAWQERGMITAMTGDGVNDAPSLKQADVGVAMGNSGTEAAKEAADMILADDNFATIVKAIQGGRNIYSNIKKSIGFLLSGNTAGILCVLTACITGLSLPFVPVQLLFINLVTDSLPAVALGMNPHTNRVMQESPRKATERIMDKGFLKRVLLEGGIIAINTMLAFLIGKTSAYAFGVLCLSRLLHGYSCKSAKHIVGKKEMWNNLGMNGAFLGGFLLLNLVFFIPILGNIFQTANLGFTGILYIYGFSILSFLEIQITKAITIRKN